MSIEKITSSILAEAEAAQKAALEEAKAKCDKIVEDAVQKAREQTEAMVKKGHEEKEKIILRRRSVAAIDSKKVILGKKQEIISDCFDQAVSRIMDLPEAEYVDYLVRVGLASDMPGGTVYFNEKEQDAIAGEVVRRLNEALGKSRAEQGKTLDESERFTLGSEPGPIRGGFWIKYGQTYADNTVGSQVAIKKIELAATVSRMLFAE